MIYHDCIVVYQSSIESGHPWRIQNRDILGDAKKKCQTKYLAFVDNL